MRPPEFTGGNCASSTWTATRSGGFNEAAGIHRRKLRKPVGAYVGDQLRASMRPPEFTGGNPGELIGVRAWL